MKVQAEHDQDTKNEVSWTVRHFFVNCQLRSWVYVISMKLHRGKIHRY